jgi:hypothetical protein
MNIETLLNLPPERRNLIESELQSGEKIVWLDQPIPRLFTMRTIPLVLFAIPWTAFAAFWMAEAAGLLGGHAHSPKGPTAVFPLFGLPFVLVGIAMLMSPVWMRRIYRGTYYVITNRRAIVFQKGFAMTTRSFAPEQLQALSKRQRADGSGDIIFNVLLEQVQVTPAGVQMNGFFSIRNVKEVEDLLLELARKQA